MPTRSGNRSSGDGHYTGPDSDPAATIAATQAVTSGLARPWTADPGRRLVRWLAYPGLPVLAIMTVAVVFRFWQLTAVGFNTDEAVYTGSAASIAGNTTLAPMFPVFRAHPLLFQTLLSLVLRVHDSDWAARGFAAGIGVATVAVTYLLGRKLYGTAAGLVAAALARRDALSRDREQASTARRPDDVLRDRGAVLRRTLRGDRPAELAADLRQRDERLDLAKETSAVLLGALYVFFALTPATRGRVRHLALTLALVLAEVAIWPVMLRLARHSNTGQSYLVWQLFRRSNHATWFYFTVLPSWIGPAAPGRGARRTHLAPARGDLAGAHAARRGLSYPCSSSRCGRSRASSTCCRSRPALAILAGRALSRPLPLRSTRRPARSTMGAAGHGGGAASLAVPAWARSQPSFSTNFLAGSGGMTGGREAGTWIARHVPAGSAAAGDRPVHRQHAGVLRAPPGVSACRSARTRATATRPTRR